MEQIIDQLEAGKTTIHIPREPYRAISGFYARAVAWMQANRQRDARAARAWLIWANNKIKFKNT